MSTCMGCGGLIMEPGKAYGWAGKTCHCFSPTAKYRFSEYPITQKGWQCPVCGTVHAPTVSSCPHKHLP